MNAHAEGQGLRPHQSSLHIAVLRDGRSTAANEFKSSLHFSF